MGKSPKTREEISVGKKQKKTNVMRILDQKKIPYTAKEYPHEEGVAVDGMTVAKSLGQEPGSVFKTLVTRGASGEYYVFDIPVAAELDLKKAAKAVGVKKPFFTTFHESATQYDVIAVSAGKIGEQVILSPQALCDLVGGQFADVIK